MSERRGRATGGGKRTLIGYLLVVIAVFAVSLGGYAGYVLYPRFDLPGVTVAGLFVLAAGAGVASFFSPCSFPLLLSIFGQTPGRERPEHPPWRQILPFAAGLSLGASAFLLIAGGFIALMGARVFGGVVFTSTEGIILRAVVGVVLILLGLIQIGLLPVSVPPIQDLADPFVDRGIETNGGTGIGRASLFGFGYLIAGFG